MGSAEKIPTTSTTLLRDLAQDSQHARWSEFVARYRPMMEAFMRERFPSLEADDVIQETLIALIKALPSYHYSPDETGHFHNYLAANRYRFQCREWSAATGLTNFRARWYDAETGRWLSKDPIGLSGGLNLYAFCGNDPIGFKDFMGLCKTKGSNAVNWAKNNRGSKRYNERGGGRTWLPSLVGTK